MERIITSLLVIFAVTSTLASRVKLSEKQKQAFLDEHNNYRKGEGASNMNKLVWDDDIAETTGKWIDRCEFEHENAGLGENLYFATMVEDDASIKDSIKDWFEEKYLPAGGYGCGSRCHYTQVVWADTQKMGCAIEKCPSLVGFGQRYKDATYVACFYTPKGNWVGEPEYITGAACSKCKEGQSCDNGLCAGEGKTAPKECKDKNPDCPGWARSGECAANPKYMSKNCELSCGGCEGGKPEAECADFDDGCADWASRGECSKNPSYMLSECKKSCDQC